MLPPQGISIDIDAIRLKTIVSGSKSFESLDQYYLEIDSGTNGAEILSIIIQGVVDNKLTEDWTCEVYVPEADGYDDLHSSHKRDEIQWDNKPEAGLISGVIGIPYNMFSNFTNNDAGARNIDDVVIVYRSDEALTLTWEE